MSRALKELVFEVILIFDPRSNHVQKVNRIKRFLKDYSTRGIMIEELGEKELAYSIKGHTAGYYYILTYATVEGSYISKCDNVSKEIRTLGEGDLLKHLILERSDGPELWDAAASWAASKQHKSEQKRRVKKPLTAPVDVFDLIFGIKE